MSMKKIWLWMTFSIGVIFLLVGGGFYFWASESYEPTQLAILAMESTVPMDGSDLLVFEPSNKESETGFIFYPGGKVDPSSYAALAQLIADQGFTVIIVPMPLNLAVLDKDKAEVVMTQFDHIRHWAIGGHSLGGVMAASFAATHEDIEGVVLFASYPLDDALKDSTVRVMSLYGSNDEVADLNKVKTAVDLLPKETLLVEIKGGNHSQFGSYGHQDGDGKASISETEQLEYAAHYTAQLLKLISE
ncbi:MAG TPA: alpha/beta hydrolase [Firmicutes bacterium]|nr:alpha/beta hydrolase [Bacillota bacterium]